MDIRIQVAHDIAACEAAAAIQAEVWSGDVVVPPQLMLAVAHNGGLTALAYADDDDRAAGFVFGFLGIFDYHFRHHSHMLAVREPYRRSGIAVRLKEAQRDHCLDQGIDTIAWTMDPLEARNARFNFARLGAFARTYHRDFYGLMPDKLNEGMPSDRLYVEWRIATDRADKRLRGAERLAPLDDAERDGVRYVLRADGDRPGAADVPRDDTHLLIGVPTDIQAIKARDRALALEWRTAARSAFEAAFTAGYAAVEMLYSTDGSRAAYVLVKQPEHPSSGDDEVSA